MALSVCLCSRTDAQCDSETGVKAAHIINIPVDKYMMGGTIGVLLGAAQASGLGVWLASQCTFHFQSRLDMELDAS